MLGGDQSRSRKAAAMANEVAALEAALGSAQAEYERVKARNEEVRCRLRCAAAGRRACTGCSRGPQPRTCCCCWWWSWWWSWGSWRLLIPWVGTDLSLVWRPSGVPGVDAAAGRAVLGADRHDAGLCAGQRAVRGALPAGVAGHRRRLWGRRAAGNPLAGAAGPVAGPVAGLVPEGSMLSSCMEVQIASKLLKDFDQKARSGSHSTRVQDCTNQPPPHFLRPIPSLLSSLPIFPAQSCLLTAQTLL